jgi:hypothetical protein
MPPPIPAVSRTPTLHWELQAVLPSTTGTAPIGLELRESEIAAWLGGTGGEGGLGGVGSSPSKPQLEPASRRPRTHHADDFEPALTTTMVLPSPVLG